MAVRHFHRNKIFKQTKVSTMKYFLNFSIAMLLLSTFSCNRQRTAIKETPIAELEPAMPVTDTLVTVEPQTPELSDAPIFDEYHGYLPCADCPGIDYKLTLKENGTYSESISYSDLTVYQDKSEDIYIYDGNFTVSGDTVLLDKGEDAIKYFLIHPQGLLLLDAGKAIIEDDIVEKYILKRKSLENEILSISEVALIEKEPENNVEFYAVGGEPDWRLDIDFDSSMSFKSLASPFALKTPAPIPEKTEDSKIINYYSETESDVLDVTIFEEPCVDDMSGEKFSHKVRVEAKDSTVSEFKIFTGCGRYVLESLLPGTWQVISINSDSLKEEDFARGLPTLMFNLRNNRLIGGMSCNRVSGLFSFTGDEISFKRLGSSGFPCETIEFEDMYLDLLLNNVFKTNLTGEDLVLRSASGSELRLRKNN